MSASITAKQLEELRTLAAKRTTEGRQFMDISPALLLSLASRAQEAERERDARVSAETFQLAQRVQDDLQARLEKAEATATRLRDAAERALLEMRNTVAPHNSFTDAVDALDAALSPAPGQEVVPFRTKAADQNERVLAPLKGAPAASGTPETDADPQNPNAAPGQGGR